MKNKNMNVLCEDSIHLVRSQTMNFQNKINERATVELTC
jgi:hypothetical protein